MCLPNVTKGYTWVVHVSAQFANRLGKFINACTANRFMSKGAIDHNAVADAPAAVDHICNVVEVGAQLQILLLSTNLYAKVLNNVQVDKIQPRKHKSIALTELPANAVDV